MNHGFTEEDKNKLVELLNFIAKKATFDGWKTEDTIQHFKLLSYAQTVLIPKIEANILEIKQVIQLNKEPEKAEKPTKPKG